MKISKSELVDILTNTDYSEITITSQGEAKMNKRGNPFFVKNGASLVAANEVLKHSIITYDFGGNYEQRVNEALVADGSQGTFKSSELAWGSWKVAGKIIEHGEKLYVRCYINRANNMEISYTVDGVQATSEQLSIIKEFTPEKKESVKQSNEGLEAEKQIIPNNVDFDHIINIEMGGVVYELS